MTEERIAQLEQQNAALKGQIANGQLRAALQAKGVRADALADAATLLASACAPTWSDDGAIEAWSVGGRPYDSAEDAAAAFVEQRRYLVQAEQASPTPTATPKPETRAAEAFARPAPAPATAPAASPKTKSVRDALEGGYSAVDLGGDAWLKPPR